MFIGRARVAKPVPPYWNPNSAPLPLGKKPRVGGDRTEKHLETKDTSIATALNPYPRLSFSRSNLLLASRTLFVVYRRRASCVAQRACGSRHCRAWLSQSRPCAP